VLVEKAATEADCSGVRVRTARNAFAEGRLRVTSIVKGFVLAIVVLLVAKES
jgi:hypothetical protein